MGSQTYAILDLSYTKITDKELKHLSGLTDLRHLDLSYTKITDKELKHLSGLTNLRTLNLGEIEITDKGLQYLSKLRNLEDLKLRAEITDEGLKKLEAALPNCVILSM